MTQLQVMMGIVGFVVGEFLALRGEDNKCVVLNLKR